MPSDKVHLNILHVLFFNSLKNKNYSTKPTQQFNTPASSDDIIENLILENRGPF